MHRMAKGGWWAAISISISISSSIVASCGGGGGERQPVVLAAVVGPEGGVVETSDEGNPLFGVCLEVPAGALAQATELRILEVLEPAGIDAAGIPSGPVVDLEPSGIAFAQPVALVLPYFDADQDGRVDGTELDEHDLVVFSRAAAGDPYVSARLVDRDPLANRLRVEIRHFSRYLSGYWPRIERGPIRVHYEPEGAVAHAFPASFDYAIARQTVLDAIFAGTNPAATWNSLTDCLAWDFELVSSMAEADVEIQWRSFASLGLPANTIARTTCMFDLPPADCQDPRAQFVIQYNEDRAADFHLSPAQDPIVGVDLFSNTAHEFAHAVGLPPECASQASATSDCNLSIPSTAHSVIDRALDGGEDTRVLTPEDVAFFEARHAIDFRERFPIGCQPVPRTAPEISVVLRTICDGALIAPGSERMKLSDGAGFSKTVGSAELTLSPPDPTSERTVAYRPGFELPQGRIRVEVSAADDLGRRAFTRWTFVTMGPPPVAAFSGSPRNGQAPLAVQFQDLSTGEIDAWAWSFGDGTSSTEANPAHVYAAPGSYTVSLTVGGPSGTDARTEPDYVHVAQPDSGTGLDCSSGVDLEVTEVNGGSALRIRWCTGDDVIQQGGAYWTLQVRAGGACPWQNQFTSMERSFEDVVGNGLGSNYCLRVIVQPHEPEGGGCETGILASDTDGTDC